MAVRSLFVTRLYEARIEAPALFDDLAHSVRSLARDDTAGRRWCRAHRYPGYTSYASLDDLPRRDPAFAALRRHLDGHVARFAALSHMDLPGKLRLDSLWASMLRGRGGHSGHIHPHSIVSGTVYVAVPPGAGAIRFEDPRLPQLMAAPLRTGDAPDDSRPFVTVAPEAGTLLLWESFLRHEVMPGAARSERISISFNYA